MKNPLFSSVLLTLSLSLSLGLALPGQGSLEMGKMWTFENAPLDYLEKEYGFRPDQKWMDALRMASLRFGGGCSASFVSPKGLIMTNHHCVRGNIAQVQGDADWVKDGFFAKTSEDEVRLSRLTVQQLISMEPVTDKMNAGIEDSDDEKTIQKKRTENRKQIIREARSKHPDLKPQVVSFYQGAMFQLYYYKVYDDIRLVCSPHLQTAHFGGDPDNFTYPRYSIDFSFCRAYEDGKPADTSKHYFRWSKSGPKANELAFVTGNPGSTGRLLTKGQMGFLRDSRYPIRLAKIDDELAIVSERAKKDPDYAKRVRTSILGMQNSQKAIGGYLGGLLNEKLMAHKNKAEKEFMGKVETNPELEKKFTLAWSELKKISAKRTALEPRLHFQVAGYSSVLGRAVAIANAVNPEVTGPAKQAARRTAERSPRKSPVLDRLYASHLARAKKWLGLDDSYVRMILGNLSPDDAVARLNESNVGDDDFVEELLDGGAEAVEKSDDIAIKAGRLVAEMVRENNRQNAELKTRESAQGTLVGQALFSCYGTKVSPDATRTLRFSDGRVKGFPFNGTIAPYRTTFYGLYGRNVAFGNKYPFNLPEIWLERKDKIDLGKGVNFVATNDIIGGNSGSPMVNKDLEVIGLIFDGNIEMLANRFLYKDDVPRSVSVHSEAIIEAMDKIYEAHRVVAELRGN